MALKKEDRLFGYSEKIGVNRGGGFQFASQVAQSQANDIDNLVGRFADAGLKDLQQFGEDEAKKALEMYDFGSEEIKVINEVTKEQESIYIPSKVEIPDTLPKTKTAIEAFEKGIYQEYEREIISAMEKIAVDERKIALTNYRSGTEYEEIVDGKFKMVLENVNPKFKDLAERTGTSLINQHGSVVVSNYNSFQRNIKNSKFSSTHTSMRNNIMEMSLHLGSDHPSVKLMNKKYIDLVDTAKENNVVDAVANGDRFKNEMRIVGNINQIFSKYTISNVSTASPSELKMAAENYSNISLLMAGQTQEVTLKHMDGDKVVETIISQDSINKLAGEFSNVINDLEIVYNKASNRILSKYNAIKTSQSSTIRWGLNVENAKNGFTSGEYDSTAKERREDWKNPDTIKVWISSFNQTYPNDILNEQELSDPSSNPEKYFKFIKYVAHVDSSLPTELYTQINDGYKDFNPRNIKAMRDSSLVSFLMNKPTFYTDDNGQSIQVNKGGINKFGFDKEAIDNMISIEQALLLNPNIDEVIKEQKEFKDKFGQIDQLTLGTAISTISGGKYKSPTAIDDEILNIIDNTLDTKFMKDVTFPTILYGAVKEEIHQGILAGNIRFTKLSHLEPHVQNALGKVISGEGVFGQSKIGYSAFTSVSLDKGEYQEAMKFVPNPPELRYGVPVTDENNNTTLSTEYMNDSIMDMFKNSNEFDLYKNFKPEVGKNIYLEAIQKDNTRYPSYYVVFVNQDGKADYLQNEDGLLMTYNPKGDFENYKAQNDITDVQYNNFKDFKQERIVNLNTSAPTKKRKETRDDPPEPIKIGEIVSDAASAAGAAVVDFFTADGINIKEASIEELQAELSALKIKKKSKSNKALAKAIQAEIDGRR